MAGVVARVGGPDAAPGACREAGFCGLLELAALTALCTDLLGPPMHFIHSQIAGSCEMAWGGPQAGCNARAQMATARPNAFGAPFCVPFRVA